MSQNILRWGLVSFACVFVMGCHNDKQVQGNGKVVAEQRELQAFDKLQVDGDIIVSLSSNQPKSTMEIRVDQNLLPYISSQIDNSVLSVTVKPKYHLKPSSPIQVVLSAQNLREINLSGGVTFVASNLKGDALDLSVKGAGTTVLKGRETSVNFNVEGSAHVNAEELRADNVQVRMLGLAQLTVNTSKRLGVFMQGKGQLTFFGDPPVVDQEVHEGGQVVRAG